MSTSMRPATGRQLRQALADRGFVHPAYPDVTGYAICGFTPYYKQRVEALAAGTAPADPTERNFIEFRPAGLTAGGWVYEVMLNGETAASGTVYTARAAELAIQAAAAVFRAAGTFERRSP